MKETRIYSRERHRQDVGLERKLERKTHRKVEGKAEEAKTGFALVVFCKYSLDGKDDDEIQLPNPVM